MSTTEVIKVARQSFFKFACLLYAYGYIAIILYLAFVLPPAFVVPAIMGAFVWSAIKWCFSIISHFEDDDQ